jgi:hypothetical protein
MKYIKTYKIFESKNPTEEFIEQIFYDITDSGDIPVGIQINDNRCLILIGDEDNPIAKDIPLHLYIDNLISLNDYMTDSNEGWTLKNIACWIKPTNTFYDPTIGVIKIKQPITAGDFNEFLEKIEEVKVWNENHPETEWKTFKLVDICYEK